jgi:16S rRNA processing protein RimM
MLLDENNKEVGEVLDVIENPANTLLEVDYKGNEALIPLNDQTFIKVDKETMKLYVKIPEGLLDIYS